jgi:hypothetical protein
MITIPYGCLADIDYDKSLFKILELVLKGDFIMNIYQEI